MIRLTDFLPVPHPDLTKVKFNMRAGSDGANACPNPQAVNDLVKAKLGIE